MSSVEVLIERPERPALHAASTTESRRRTVLAEWYQIEKLKTSSATSSNQKLRRKKLENEKMEETEK